MEKIFNVDIVYEGTQSELMDELNSLDGIIKFEIQLEEDWE
jgi:hypothetical protein